MSDYAFRFGGLARLYGADGLARLRQAHVAVIGLGGVGSSDAEPERVAFAAVGGFRGTKFELSVHSKPPPNTLRSPDPTRQP